MKEGERRSHQNEERLDPLRRPPPRELTTDHQGKGLVLARKEQEKLDALAAETKSPTVRPIATSIRLSATVNPALYVDTVGEALRVELPELSLANCKSPPLLSPLGSWSRTLKKRPRMSENSGQKKAKQCSPNNHDNERRSFSEFPVEVAQKSDDERSDSGRDIGSVHKGFA